jgi:hypothetical protein
MGSPAEEKSWIINRCTVDPEKLSTTPSPSWSAPLISNRSSVTAFVHVNGVPDVDCTIRGPLPAVPSCSSPEDAVSWMLVTFALIVTVSSL